MVNIIENNKLIAEFIGAKRSLIDVGSYEMFGLIDSIDQDDAHFYTPRMLAFNDDWNWLMAVVARIYDTDLYHTEYINYNSSMVDDGKLKLSTNIQDVYKACVEFIKWYNLNSK